jgi:hypothetical protein
MVHTHEIVVRPVQIIGQKRHLLIEAFPGIERYPGGAFQRQRTFLLKRNLFPRVRLRRILRRLGKASGGKVVCRLRSPL